MRAFVPVTFCCKDGRNISQHWDLRVHEFYGSTGIVHVHDSTRKSNDFGRVLPAVTRRAPMSNRVVFFGGILWYPI